MNFKVPYSKEISKWGSRLSCISKGSSKEVKDDPTKLKEIKEVAKLCRIIVAMADELAPDSFNHNPIFITCFVQDLVDPRFEGPHNILA